MRWSTGFARKNPSDSRSFGRRLLLVLLPALATKHGGRFVTFDRAVALSAVPAATPENLTVLG
jgi:hypothetical protein